MRFNSLGKARAFLFLAMAILITNDLGAVPPQEKILLIYTNWNGVSSTQPNYPVELEQAFYNALLTVTPAANITTLLIPNGQDGIYNELNSAGLTLSEFCQVYDLRFGDQEGNAYTLNAAAPPPDYLTYFGANSDAQLYENYLAQGGSLFIQAEHTDYRTRDVNILQLVDSVATLPINTQYPDVITSTLGAYPPDPPPGAVTINSFTGAYGFNTNDNNISAGATIYGNYVGGIPAGDYGSGQSLTNLSSATSSGNLQNCGCAGSMALAWESNALNSPYSTGKLVVSFETNAFTETELQDAASTEWIQNLYTLLSGCVHYTVAKTFVPNNLCLGSPGTFTLCATNTSTTAALTNYTFADTIPTCLTYTSSNPSPTGNSGHFYWWTIPSITAGNTACVTVQFNATSIPPCP